MSKRSMPITGRSVLFASALVVLSSMAAGLAIAQTRSPRSTVTLDARLTGVSAGPGIPCGAFGWASVSRYHVVRVVRGQYARRALLAVAVCGSVPGGGRLGEVHRLDVRPLPADFRLQLYDDFRSDPSPRLLMVRGRPAPR